MMRMGLAHKFRLAFACLFCLAATLAGAEIVENAAYSGPKTTIRYSLWGGADEVSDARLFCQQFVALHPEIRLDVSVFPWGQYWAKLQTQMASGLAPDVMEFYSQSFGEWVARGALLPLDDLAKKDNFKASDFSPAPLENCRWNGRLYSLPTDIAIWSIVYSTDLLEQSGIRREDWPKSDRAMPWDQFVKLCKRLTLRNSDGSFAQYGMSAGQNWDLIISGMNGGDIVDRPVNPTRSAVKGNEPLARALISLYQSQYGDRTTLGSTPLSSGAFSVNSDTILISPKFAMGTTGPWALKQLKDAGVHFGVTPVPVGDKPHNVTSVNSVAIYFRSKHPQESWEFLRFLTSLKSEQRRGMTLKGIPTVKAAQDSLIHNVYGIKGCEAFIHDLNVASPYLTPDSNDIVSARDKWLSTTEDQLEVIYDARLAALPRENGAISTSDYSAFVKEMNSTVEKTIRKNLPDLDAALQSAIDASKPKAPGPWLKFAMPLLAGLVLALAAFAYIRGVARERSSDLPAADNRKLSRAGYWFVAPWLIGLVCFVLGPILAATFLSFTDWNMISPPTWVGFQHYADLPHDPKFLAGVEHTFGYALLVIPISLIGGLFTAGLLTSRIRGADVFKAIIYFPALFTGAETAVLWVNMLNKDHGVLNLILSWIHVAPIDWMNERHAFYSVILMNVFWIGGAMIIYYAGMKQIPVSLYEAADLDGASLSRKFLRITIPLLSPVILFMVVMTTIGSFQVFTPALFFASSSSDIGSPNDALRFYSVNIYDQAFNNLRMGLACSYAIVLFLIIFVITYLQLRVAKRFVYTEGG
jgi:multiple sugar transport system permease protein